jgi:hypothetical protein
MTFEQQIEIEMQKVDMLTKCFDMIDKACSSKNESENMSFEDDCDFDF